MVERLLQPAYLAILITFVLVVALVQVARAAARWLNRH